MKALLLPVPHATSTAGMVRRALHRWDSGDKVVRVEVTMDMRHLSATEVMAGVCQWLDRRPDFHVHQDDAMGREVRVRCMGEEG